MKLIKQFYQYIWRYKWVFMVGLILIIASQIFANLSNYYIKNFFDVVSSGSIDTVAITNIIAQIVIVYLISTILGLFAWTISDYYILEAGRKLKIEIVSRLHDLDFAYHANKKSGSLISIIRRGDSAFYSFNHELNREILIIAVDFVFIAVAFSSLNWVLAAIVAVAVIATLLSTRYLLDKNITARKAFNDKEDQISGIVADNLINFETVKFFAKEIYEQKRLVSKFKEWWARVWGYMFSFRLIEVVTSLVNIIAMVAIFVVSLNLYSLKVLNVGELVLVLTFTLKFFPQMFSLIFRLREIAKNYTDLEKYLAITKMNPQVKDKANAVALPLENGFIEFKNVHFSYNKKNNVIDGLNLKIEPNESVAFVGVSGAGKSTLIKLLLRFYDVDKGAITINGIDLKDVKKPSLREHIGIVPQEPILFNDTIRYNVCYPNPTATVEDMKLAVRMANLEDFIESLPEKYETEVGERGIKLSGGQKQRLAIARIFIANCPVMVFDEATSQLDSESEKLIQDSLWKIAKSKTTIIIAHRLSTVMRADRIIVLANGKIAEIGKHHELINKNNGIYKKLWDMQRGGMTLIDPD